MAKPRNKGEYIAKYGSPGGGTPTYTEEQGPSVPTLADQYAAQGYDPSTGGFQPLYGSEPNDPFNPRVDYNYDEYRLPPGVGVVNGPTGYNMTLGANAGERAMVIGGTPITTPSAVMSDRVLGNNAFPALQDMGEATDSAFGTLRRQQDWGEYLKAVAEGRAGPSAAELERERALGQSQRQALALAASARQPGAYRAAFDAQEQMASQAASDAMIARANEMTAARQAYDQNLAGTADTANTAAAIAQGRATAADTVAGTEWAHETDAAKSRMEQQQGIWSAENAARNTALGYNTEERAWAEANADSAMRAEELKQKALADQAELRNQNDQFNANQSGKTTKGFLGGAGSVLSAMSLSDVRAKEAIAPAPPEQAQQDLRRTPIYSYQYRDPTQYGAAPGRQVGPMAQDLARTETFRGAVQPGEDGMLRIDPNRLTLGTLSAQKGQQAEIDRQAAELERVNAELEKLGAKSGEQLLGFEKSPASPEAPASKEDSYSYTLPATRTNTSAVGNIFSAFQ